MNIDVIAFSPHPDDAEIGCGGLLLKLKDLGYKTAIVDLTEGELSTRGSIKTRRLETEKASEILKLDLRINLNLGDCFINNSKKNILKVIEVIREYRPKMALIPYFIDRHPDHENSYKLLKESLFFSGLVKYPVSIKKEKNNLVQDKIQDQIPKKMQSKIQDKLKETLKINSLKRQYSVEKLKEAHRPNIVISYMLHYQFTPSFIVDISNYYHLKMKACRAYKSQLYLTRDNKNYYTENFDSSFSNSPDNSFNSGYDNSFSNSPDSGYFNNSSNDSGNFNFSLNKEDFVNKNTFINSKYFRQLIYNRDKFYGLKIKSDYGEPYYIEESIKIDNPIEFFKYLGQI